MLYGHRHCAALLRAKASDLSRCCSTGPRTELLQDYLKDVEKGKLKADANQKSCVYHMNQLLSQLPSYTAAAIDYNNVVRGYRQKRDAVRKQLLEQEEARRLQKEQHQGSGGLFWQFKRFWQSNEPRSATEIQADAFRFAIQREQKLDEILGTEPNAPQPPKGIYIYGSVGSGKTMLMDRFYDAAKKGAVVPYRRRMHFNAALMEVHSRMHAYERDEANSQLRSQLELGCQDPEVERQKQAKLAKLAVRRYLRQRMRQSDQQIAESMAKSNAVVFSKVAASLIRGTDGFMQHVPQDDSEDLNPALLCFDEVNVNDPFTALALKGIFEALIDSGTVILATSNRHPADLNHFGVHEVIFEHFKQRLMDACDLVNVSCADFRREASLVDGASPLGGRYLFPLTPKNCAKLEHHWEQAVEAEGHQCTALTIPVLFGRTLLVEQAAGGVARFTFSDLCDAVKGASDYYAIAQNFHTVFLTDIPFMSLQDRNLARRFILLVDELYNSRVTFRCTAAAAPEELFTGTSADPTAIVDLQQLEELQFESAAEGTRLRRDVMAPGGVAPVFSIGTSAVTTTQLGGLEEKFAFARAVSRLYEMSRPA